MQILQTGDENADQVISIPVPGRSSPLVVIPTAATPPSAATFERTFVCTNIATTQFLRTDNIQSAGTATRSVAWHFLPVAGFALTLAVQLSVAHTADFDLTLFLGATLAGAGGVVNVVVPAGVLNAQFVFFAPIAVAVGDYLLIEFQSSANYVGAMQATLGLA